MTRSRIAFTGPFADVNFGDYAMLVNNIADLEPTTAVLYSYDTPFLTSIRQRYFPHSDMPIVTVAFDEDFTAQLKSGYIPTPLEVIGALRDVDLIRDTMSQVDTLVINGGGYLNGLWARPHRIDRLMRILAPALLAQQMGVRIALTGNGVGPFFGYDELFASIFQSLGPVTYHVRDRYYSAANLRRAGVADRYIVNVPDDLFAVNPSLLSEPRQPLNLPDRYVVLETYLPVTELTEMRGALDDFAHAMRNEGIEILFLPFNLGDGGVNQGRYLSETLNGLRVYDIQAHGFLPIEDAFSIVRGAEFVVSTRYHALVLALSCGTPVINALRDVMGDKRYYYGKAMGALEVALPGTHIDPALFMASSYDEALVTLTEKFPSIRDAQLALYNTYLSAGFRQSKADRATLIREIVS